jgi:hypothetical protein
VPLDDRLSHTVELFNKFLEGGLEGSAGVLGDAFEGFEGPRCPTGESLDVGLEK